MLAIIIPAYKSKYLSETLQSLVNQTNQNFRVYVGNDASPENLKDIVERYRKYINITYKEFDNNIGAEKLVMQWQRCIELSTDEDWIWLFSDDDIADTICVENFYTALQSNQLFEVYRFNTVVIDGEGKVLKHSPVGPPIESSEEMAYNLFLGKRGNSMPDHIFSRKVYSDTGGLVFTEYAQSADWAASIKFSKEKGIAVIPDAKVYWRYSGMNITSNVSTIKSKTIKGYLTFLRWATHHFQYLKQHNQGISYEQMIHSLAINCRLLFINHYKGIPLSMIFSVQRILTKHLNKKFFESLKLIYKINKSQAEGNLFSKIKAILGL